MVNKSISTKTPISECYEFCQKTYKDFITNNNRMFPSDLTGSLDVLFEVLSPRYLRKSKRGFLFVSGGVL